MVFKVKLPFFAPLVILGRVPLASSGNDIAMRRGQFVRAYSEIECIKKHRG